jgi:EamA domain-containing membrane protein RarD
MNAASRFTAVVALVACFVLWCFFGLVMYMAAFNEGGQPGSPEIILFVVIWSSVALLALVSLKRLLRPLRKVEARTAKNVKGKAAPACEESKHISRG